jgi:hypothetical protein
MKYTINNRELQYFAEGEKSIGSESVLLQNDIDLTKNTDWSSVGFSIEKFLDTNTFQIFEGNTYDLLIKCWKIAGLDIPQHFELDQYHVIASDNSTHLGAVEKTKLLPVLDFPIDIKILEERISDICSEELEVKNPFDNQSVFHFRVIRPNTNDNNPLHRDVWLEDYKDCINLYIPVAGSSELSSLILLPGSHHWAESKVERTQSGAIINGVKFNVPAVTSILCDFEAVRPNPQKNEMLVFSPYLIHGGSMNFDQTKTRISIEIRLWKKS